ncbi:FadR/GntR family transcriptional regulator [Stackebrandtia nassauensis]|uniref:GntR domain protein n=1 Tax=Stackebrandtia nassauensis (strain DSM 44728 / CIP 108903 / NRRL B-16338 / NBRC 102104 / LLR-40K-21) TaxID=446470 RepID=D3PUQ8_STANL|nr:FCD domain-containing protein [Stackebrandtia nassauensis]ADD44932.1 GntR domain protein [Stackebrandtia nassauensis DSM 44728]
MASPVLHSAVLDTLGMRITSGELAPGAVLTLEGLRQEFGVSRTVMREVMRLLESMNLVLSRRRVGLVVRPSDEWRVFDPRVIRWRLDGPGRDAQLRTLTDLRSAVEPLAAAGAARHATDADRERIVELAALMRQRGEAGQLEDFLELDIEFHSLLLRASRNEMFAALTEVVAEVLAGRTHHGLMPKPPEPVALDLHEEVARSIHAGADRDAESAMRGLVEEVRAAFADETAN